MAITILTEQEKAAKQKAALEAAGIIPDDELFLIVSEIEKLTDQEDALIEAHAHMDVQLVNQLKLGGVLSLMKRQKWYCGRKSFGDMVMAEFGFKLAKADELVRVYDTIVEMEVPYDDALKVGITKLRLLCRQWWIKTITDEHGNIDKEAFSYAVGKLGTVNPVFLRRGKTGRA